MRVFMTGGTGYIGSAIVLELLRHGHELTLLARNPDKIPEFRGRTGIEFIHGSLEDTDLIRSSLPGHDACIHNAILWDDAPTELELKDTRASVVIFEACAKAGVEQVLYTSSTAVHRPFNGRMSEEDRIQPDDAYGATKACSEMFLSAISHQHPIRCNVIRPGPVMGPPAASGVNPNCHSRFSEYLEAARQGVDITVVEGEGRQFISVADLAKLYAAVLESRANRETYLAVAREFTSWEQIARTVIQVTGSSSQVIVEDGDCPGEQPFFDVIKIERDFGCRFQTGSALREHIIHLAG